MARYLLAINNDTPTAPLILTINTIKHRYEIAEPSSFKPLKPRKRALLCSELITLIKLGTYAFKKIMYKLAHAI